MRAIAKLATFVVLVASVSGCSAGALMRTDMIAGHVYVGAVSEPVPAGEEMAVHSFEITDSARFQCTEDERAYFVTAMVREINKLGRWKAHPDGAGTPRFHIRAEAAPGKAWFRLYRDGRTEAVYEYSRSYSANDPSTKWFFTYAAEQFARGLADGVR